MSNWKEYKLGDVANVKGGKRLPRGVNLTTEANKHPYIRVRDLGSKKTLELDSSYEYVDDETQKKIARYIVNEGDIIISIVGTIGLVAIIGSSLDNANLTENCVKLIDLKGIDKEFLYYFLISDKGKNEIEKGVVGAVQAKLPIKNIQAIKIKAPNINDQKRIASILSTIDSKIECNRRINDNLEQQAQALFKSWFVDFEPFKDQPFVESELGMIPKGWKVVYFKDFITPTTEKVPVGSLPEYSVTNNGIIPRDAKFNKKLSKEPSKNKVLRKDNLVFGMSREILNWGIMEDEIGGVSSAYNVYKIDKGIIDPIYLRLYMKARISDFNSLIGTAAREGQSLDKGALMQKTVYVPSTKIIGVFFRLYFSIVALQKEAENESRRLAELRDTLLPRLMSGEISVNEIEK